jgi:hypothetical protein
LVIERRSLTRFIAFIGAFFFVGTGCQQASAPEAEQAAAAKTETRQLEPQDPYLSMARYLVIVLDEQYLSIGRALSDQSAGKISLTDLRETLDKTLRAQERAWEENYKKAAVPDQLKDLDASISRANDLHRQALKELLSYWETRDPKNLTSGFATLQTASGVTRQLVRELDRIGTGVREIATRPAGTP